MRTTNFFLTLFLLAIMAPSLALALDLAWRDAAPFSAGTTVLGLKSTFETADQLHLNNRAAITQGTSLYTSIETLEINQYESLLGQPCLLGVWVPRYQAGGKLFDTSLTGASGLADPYLEVAFWPVHRLDWGTDLALANFVSLPIGAYQPQRRLNAGGNRWTDDFIIGALQTITSTGLKLEITADATIYGPNSNANATHQELTETPTYRAQIWLSQNLSSQVILALGYNELWGGQTKINGTGNGLRSDERQIRLGAEYHFSERTILEFSAYRDIYRNGGYPWDQVYQMMIFYNF